MKSTDTSIRRIEKLVDELNTKLQTTYEHCEIRLEYSSSNQPYQLYAQETHPNTNEQQFREELGHPNTKDKLAEFLEGLTSAMDVISKFPEPTEQNEPIEPVGPIETEFINAVPDRWHVRRDPMNTNPKNYWLEYYENEGDTDPTEAITVEASNEKWRVVVQSNNDPPLDTSTVPPVVKRNMHDTRTEAYTKAIEYSKEYANSDPEEPNKIHFRRTDEYHRNIETISPDAPLWDRLETVAEIVIDAANKQNINDLEALSHEIATHDIVGTGQPMCLGEAFRELAAFTEIKQDFDISECGGNHDLIKQISMPGCGTMDDQFSHVVYYGLQELWGIALYEQVKSISK